MVVRDGSTEREGIVRHRAAHQATPGGEHRLERDEDPERLAEVVDERKHAALGPGVPPQPHLSEGDAAERQGDGQGRSCRRAEGRPAADPQPPPDDVAGRGPDDEQPGRERQQAAEQDGQECAAEGDSPAIARWPARWIPALPPASPVPSSVNRSDGGRSSRRSPGSGDGVMTAILAGR